MMSDTLLSNGVTLNGGTTNHIITTNPINGSPAKQPQTIYIIQQGQPRTTQNIEIQTSTSKKRKRINQNVSVENSHQPKKIKVHPDAIRDDKRSPLPSTTTIESASTKAEERAIRNAYVTIDGKHVCGECGNCLATSWGLDAHIKSVHGKKAFRCEFCDKSFGRKDHLVNHTKSMHTGIKECSQCGVMCSGKDGLTKHIAEKHPIIPTTFHQCPNCGRNFPTENACNGHISQEHTLTSCQHCNKLCDGTDGLQNHINKDHSSTANDKGQFHIEVVFKCEYCSGTFSQQSSLDEHIKSFHLDLQCTGCGSSLVGTQAVLNHVQENHHVSKVIFNTGEVSYNCEICETTFEKGNLFDEHFLENHVYSKTGSHLVKFPSLQPIISEEINHSISNQTPASTSSNLKPLIQNASLQGTDQALNVVYQCAHCAIAFTDEQSMTKHMDSTHPETFALPTEPLPPSILAEFQQKEDKTDDVYFQCYLCNQILLDSESLETHIEAHHNAKEPTDPLNVLYECSHCKALFGEKHILESHILTEHQSKIKGEDKILSSGSNNFILEPGLVEEKYRQLFEQAEAL